MKKLIFLASLATANITFAQVSIGTDAVGIGINAPSSNAALDVTSTNKGVMLPRLNNTAAVSTPSAGLMIYDKSTNTPAFHDGTQWNTVAVNSVAAVANPDVITYTITNSGSSGFTDGTYNMLSWSNGVSNSSSFSGTGRAYFQDFHFTKISDINSVGFFGAVSNATSIPTMVIEIKIYHSGAAIPYKSIKLTNIIATSFSAGGVSSDNNLNEQISVTSGIIGYKDWVNNKSIAFNTTTTPITVVAY